MNKHKKHFFLIFILLLIISVIFNLYKTGQFDKKSPSKVVGSGVNINKPNLTKQEKDIMLKCIAFQKSQNIAQTFEEEYKNEFTGLGKTLAENKLYDIVITYIKEGKKYQDFETELFTILGEADGDEAKPLRFQINFIYKFFYSQNFDEEFKCEELIKNIIK